MRPLDGLWHLIAVCFVFGTTDEALVYQMKEDRYHVSALD